MIKRQYSSIKTGCHKISNSAGISKSNQSVSRAALLKKIVFVFPYIPNKGFYLELTFRYSWGWKVYSFYRHQNYVKPCFFFVCFVSNFLMLFQGLDMVHFIEYISCKLKTHRGLYNVFPITSAKVPIVKFKHRRTQLEGDISMYNLLVCVNLQLLLLLENIMMIDYFSLFPIFFL